MGEYPSKIEKSSPYSITDTISGTISSSGGMAYLDVTLAPGDIVQASLKSPNNADIDYDLYLYMYNSDGSLSGPVALSCLKTYINGSAGTVDEGLAYINSTSSTNSYALIVKSAVGYSLTEPFYLTISLDEQGYYDSNEPNDSPFTATELDSVTQLNITGANLNVSNDQDWYCWKMPGYAGRTIVNIDQGYSAEIYVADDSGSMILVAPENDGKYNLKKDNWYYLRVFYSGNSFISNDYTLTTFGDGIIPFKLSYRKFHGDMGDAQVDYGKGVLDRFEEGFVLTFTVSDQNGFPINNQRVNVKWISGADSKVTHDYYGISDDAGGVKVVCYPGSAVGVLRGETETGFIHRYDLDTLEVTCGSLKKVIKLYHYAYSV